MILDGVTLKRIYKNPPTGSFQPYLGGSRREVDRYVRDLATALAQSDLMAVSIDSYDLDNGYIAHLRVAFNKKFDPPFDPAPPVLMLYLSTKAPIAIWGAAYFVKSEYRHLWSDIAIDTIGIPPAGNWDRELEEIAAKLSTAGMTIADQEIMKTELPFDVDFREYHQSGPPYTAFDLLFSWN